MSNSIDRDLPYLQSATHFRRYEDYIFRIVNNWPNITTFDPKADKLSPETLSTRIRICIKSLADHQHDTKIPFAKFMQIHDEIVTSTAATPGKVVCGPVERLRKLVPLGQPVEVNPSQIVPKVNLVNPDNDLMKAIIVLHHHAMLTEPSVIETDRPDYIEGMKVLYDVEVVREGNKFTIL